MTSHRVHTCLKRVALLTVLVVAGLAVSATAQSPTAAPGRGRTAGRCNNRITRGEEANAERDLDRHPQIDRQLERDPRLIDNHRYLAAHPSLENYLGGHPEIRQDWKQHPYAFEQGQRRYDRHEYRKPYSSFR